MEEMALIGIIAFALMVGAGLVLLVALGRLRRPARIVAIVGSILSLGVAMWAGGQLPEPQGDHSTAMDQCLYYTAKHYENLSHQEAQAQARTDCEKQLADEPDSFDWYWLT